MRSLVFEADTWSEFESLQLENEMLCGKLCRILKELMQEDPQQGMGKPQLLRHKYDGLWSRRLTAIDRIIYSFDKNKVYIYAIGGRINDY